MNTKLLPYLVSLLLCVVFTSCLFDSSSDTITGKYEVLWIDVPEQQVICKRETSSGCWDVVSPYVFAVGHNDDFIIAKQHPAGDFKSGFKIDTTITNYYIIDIRKEDENTYGPMDETEFKKVSRKLGISHLEFDMIYPIVP